MAFENWDAIRALSILDVCDALGIPVARNGRSYWCKLRSEEKTASCKLYVDQPGKNDSFCDFGNCNNGGDNIKFASCWLGCDYQTASEQLARMFNIEPLNNTQYYNRNELTDLDWRKLGVYGDLATKNFEFDLEKQPLEYVQKLSEMYAMPVEQLRKEHPAKYEEEILRKRAIPTFNHLRNDYYFNLYCCLKLQKTLTGHFDINNVPPEELKGLSTLCKQVEQAESLLLRALKGTDLHIKPGKYNVLQDLKQINFGEISFEIGDNLYYEMKKMSRLYGVDLRYRRVPVDTYLSLNDYGLESIPHAAFLKNHEVNIVILPDHGDVLDRCIGLQQNAQKLSVLRDAVAIEYKGVVFDSWDINGNGEVVGVLCERCAENYSDVIGDELQEVQSDGFACSVKGCEAVDGAGSRCYQVVFDLDLVKPVKQGEMSKQCEDPQEVQASSRQDSGVVLQDAR